MFMSFLSQYKVLIAFIAAIVILSGLFGWSLTRNASAKQQLLDAEESCNAQISEMQKQVDALREEVSKSADTCDLKVTNERKRCDGLVTTYRELVDVKEDEKTIIHDLQENKAKAYEAVYRRLGYLPADSTDSE
jgi:cell division protein FtsB